MSKHQASSETPAAILKLREGEQKYVAGGQGSLPIDNSGKKINRVGAGINFSPLREGYQGAEKAVAPSELCVFLVHPHCYHFLGGKSSISDSVFAPCQTS